MRDFINPHLCADDETVLVGPFTERVPGSIRVSLVSCGQPVEAQIVWHLKYCQRPLAAEAIC